MQLVGNFQWHVKGAVILMYVIFTVQNGLASPTKNTKNLDNIAPSYSATGELQHAPIGAKKCMQEDLGCFVMSKDFFHIIYRPINLLPNDRFIINTKFHLYTRENPKEYWTLHANNTAEIRKSPLNKNHPTRFIIHGFLDSKWYGKWMEVLKDNLLLHSDNNVIIVDWSGGNSLPYSQAVANTRVVGAEIALLINRLQEIKEIDAKRCHIIGHSLGAHAAGYAGERIKDLGRISGIDPAEPFFQYMPPTVRLDQSDADFVDVIHTDSVSILLLGLGMSQAIGHVDFYPNDGKNQPGCKTEAIKSLFLEGLLEATRRFTACSHQRAVDFFIYSINYRRVTPVGYHCQSWENYTNGLCTSCGADNSHCAVMGIRADDFKKHKNASQPLKFYLQTSGVPPYWVSQYKITVQLSKPAFKKPSNQQGKFNIIFRGEYGNFKIQWPHRAIDLIHGGNYSFIENTGSHLGSIQDVTISWQSSSWNIFKTKELYIHHIRIVPLHVIDKTEKEKLSAVFCGNQESAISSGKKITLYKRLCKI